MSSAFRMAAFVVMVACDDARVSPPSPAKTGECQLTDDARKDLAYEICLELLNDGDLRPGLHCQRPK